MSLLAVVSVCAVTLVIGFVAGLMVGRKRRRLHRRTGFRSRGADRPLVR